MRIPVIIPFDPCNDYYSILDCDGKQLNVNGIVLFPLDIAVKNLHYFIMGQIISDLRKHDEDKAANLLENKYIND